MGRGVPSQYDATAKLDKHNSYYLSGVNRTEFVSTPATAGIRSFRELPPDSIQTMEL